MYYEKVLFCSHVSTFKTLLDLLGLKDILENEKIYTYWEKNKKKFQHSFPSRDLNPGPSGYWPNTLPLG